MTREIKFRAWDKVNNKMMFPSTIGFGNVNNRVVVMASLEIDENTMALNNDGLRFKDDFELMQYTGLKDKNGKEVYEGDILKSDLDEVMIDTVEWDADGVSFHLKNVSTGFSQLRIEDWEWEVIGNIYENPELLK